MAEKLTDVASFLRGRGVPEETVSLIEEQKIDKEVIMLMEDVQLAQYLPSYGDRVALFNFCKLNTNPSKRKQGLFEKLREKLKLRKETHREEEEPDTSHKAKSRAKRSTRNVEIGWIHTDNEVTKQVRAKQGGGTRKVTMKIQAGYDEILKQGKDLFFPEGTSSKGNESDFEFDVWDFKQNPLPKEVLIESIYSTVKLPILRFYLATKPKRREESDDELSFASAAIHVSEPAVEPADEGSTLDLISDRNQLGFINEPHSPLQELFFFSEESIESSTHENPTSSSTFINVISDPIALSVDANYIVLSDVSEVSEVDNSDPEIIFGAQQTTNNESLSDTLLYQPDDFPPSPLHTLPEITLVLHHTNSFSEMIVAFSNPEIMNKTLKVKRILPDNSVEKGSGSGIVRDSFSSFWEEFYERCTLGTTLKVPFLRHDFSAATWRAIGRILLKGFQDYQYFPIKLAPPFVEELLFGAVHSDLKTSFLQFVSCQEQDVIRQALNDFSSVDADDLLEVLTTYECRKKLSTATLPLILDEISHKELVQKPMFVIDCWRDITKPHLHLNSEQLTKMYSDLKPSPRKVVGILNFPAGMTQKEAEVSQHLKRYIRELNEEKLGRFLRFCTGSDLLISGQINVEFAVQSSFTRRPVAHTCGMVLKLSDSYDHFPDFRSEFNSILESKIWIMDIL
ncbi:uncharacterized protein LOC121635197 [Melanotaenia boesemani]|uniref:uncharacterized protein LOC121635197 n=1 Tax=Melanotaenia boesemani TaxID=1250792 RepID=UPI001C03F5BE|nr:uncharacterized protein LOC121635197 [Melanotaenia boesemani]